MRVLTPVLAALAASHATSASAIAARDVSTAQTVCDILSDALKTLTWTVKAFPNTEEGAVGMAFLSATASFQSIPLVVSLDPTPLDRRSLKALPRMERKVVQHATRLIYTVSEKKGELAEAGLCEMVEESLQQLAAGSQKVHDAVGTLLPEGMRQPIDERVVRMFENTAKAFSNNCTGGHYEYKPESSSASYASSETAVPTASSTMAPEESYAYGPYETPEASEVPTESATASGPEETYIHSEGAQPQVSKAPGSSYCNSTCYESPSGGKSNGYIPTYPTTSPTSPAVVVSGASPIAQGISWLILVSGATLVATLG